MERKLESLKRNPGISRLLIRDSSGAWVSPKRGKQFRATRQVTGPSGRPMRESKYFFNLSDALAYRRGDDQKDSRGTHQPTHSAVLTFEELVEQWTQQKLVHLEASTRARYISQLKHLVHFGKMPVGSIRPSDIDHWLAKIKSPSYLENCNATRCEYRHEFTVLRGLLSFYRERFDDQYALPFRRDHTKMLTVRVQAKKVKDLSQEEFQRFLVALREVCLESGDADIPLLARMQYMTATRIQEAAALKVEDFDLENKRLYVQRRIQWVRRRGVAPIVRDGAKAGLGKTLIISRSLAEAFNEAKLALGVRAGFLFFRDGQPLSYRQIEYRYNQAFKRAGLDFTGTHIIRHAALSEVQEHTKDLRVTMAIAGHTDVKSTIRYAKARDTAIAAALDVLSSHSAMNSKTEAVSQTVAN